MNAADRPRTARIGRHLWWKDHEKVAYLFEKLLKPFETHIEHDTKQRDIVGTFRQLDVGIIDEIAGERRVKSFVEVQKRKTKVSIQDLGDWDYKRRTLGASDITIISEAGYSKSVLDHVRVLHRDTIRLGKLHQVESGSIERFHSTCLGIVRVWEPWGFAGIFVQFADKDEISGVEITPNFNFEEKLFGLASPMDLIRNAETEGAFPPKMLSLIMECPNAGLTYNQRPIKRVIIAAEKQRRVWEPRTRFFTYSGIYPQIGQQGIAVISDFKLDFERNVRLTLVVVPDPDNVSGNQAKVAGQLEII
jgi:hypothetical protein